MEEGLKRVASMVVLRHGSKYLLLKRANEPNKGKYLPVGGKLKPFESPAECAIRETKEESGLDLDNLTFFGTLIETSPTKYNWISYIYLSDIEDIEPENSTEGILEWIESSELQNIPTPATDWFIYRFIDQNQKFALNAIYDKDLFLVEMTEELTDSKLNIDKNVPSSH
jgi:8-oxo-dGTP diphosphatase